MNSFTDAIAMAFGEFVFGLTALAISLFLSITALRFGWCYVLYSIHAITKFDNELSPSTEKEMEEVFKR